MTANKAGRPVEMHLTTMDTVDLDAMPLITSMAYGEVHVSKMINMATSWIISPGIFTGYLPEPDGGLNLAIKRDESSGFSVALVNVGIQQIRIFQQHDIILDMVSGVKNFVVLEGFYEDGTKTSQVSATSTTPPARIRRLLEEEVNSEHIIICTVDLRNGEQEILPWMIDLTLRTSCNVDVNTHVTDLDPHPQYNPRQRIHIITDNSMDLSDTNINLIVGDYEKQLYPLEDGAMIEVEILSSIDLDAVNIVLTPPEGESMYFKGQAGSSFQLRRSNCKLYRYNGSWHI